MSYPKYRILELTDQFDNKRFYPQIKKSFFADLLSWLILKPFGEWRCLAEKKDDPYVGDYMMEIILETDKGFFLSEAGAKELIEKHKTQEKESKQYLLAEKFRKAELDKAKPIFKTIKKIYV